MDVVDTVLTYHEQTKHHFHRYARSLGMMDWANQPDPFRRFDGAPLIELPLAANDTSPPYDRLYRPGAIASQPISRNSIGQLFEFSLAISAWKQYGDSRWALRCNPSSGNLHPTEGYLLIEAVSNWLNDPGVYHYAPREHALERRTSIPPDTWRAMVADYPPGTFFVGLSSVHWREVWKYGERGYRYCQHDVGHALAAMVISAAALGWRVFLLASPSDAQVAALLGIDRTEDYVDAEPEHPDLLAAVVTDGSAPFRESPLATMAVEQIAASTWYGLANRLSAKVHEWPIIEEIANACRKPITAPRGEISSIAQHTNDEPNVASCDQSAQRIIRKRRSAVAMDGHTAITRDTFYQMLSRVMPTPGSLMATSLGPPVAVHLAMFVHRVVDLAAGLYFLVRRPQLLETLRAATCPHFHWTTPPGCPKTLPLYFLIEGDARRAAGTVSCGQAIAADGAFSLGMIAEFEPLLRENHPWMYRKLFWETGMIGQVLYLEAVAANVSATGIGCFFDDPVHELFGLTGRRFQSLYHFTAGGAVDDDRLTTLPPYDTKRR